MTLDRKKCKQIRLSLSLSVLLRFFKFRDNAFVLRF